MFEGGMCGCVFEGGMCGCGGGDVCLKEGCVVVGVGMCV